MPESLFNKVAGLAGRLLLKESSKVYIPGDIIMSVEDVTTSFPSSAMIQQTPFFYKQ